jgi:hypothetical protein
MAQNVFTLPMGSVKYKFNEDGSANYLGTTFNYNLGCLNYKSEYTNKTNVQNLGLNYKKFSLNFQEINSDHPSYLTTLKFDNFYFSDQKLSTMRVDSLSYSSDKYKINYIISDKAASSINFWKQTYFTKSILDFQNRILSFKIMDHYSEQTLAYKNIKIQFADSPTQKEKDFSYAFKDLSIIDSKYSNNSYNKNFLEVKSKTFDLKTVNDKGLNAGILTYGNTIVAHDNKDNFIQSNLGKAIYKISEIGGNKSFSLNYQNLTYNDKQWYYNFIVNKSINAQFSSNKIHAVNYAIKYKDMILSCHYTETYNIYDFYFNQSVFSPYNNNYNAIGKSNINYKKSCLFSISNPNFSFNYDRINNMFALNYKNIVSFTRDQKGDYLSLQNTKKLGSISYGYNFTKHKLDKFQFIYSFKF